MDLDNISVSQRTQTTNKWSFVFPVSVRNSPQVCRHFENLLYCCIYIYIYIYMYMFIFKLDTLIRNNPVN